VVLACALSRKEKPEEREDSSLVLMIDELVAWFEQEYSVRFNTGINCSDILQDDSHNSTTRCPKIVMTTFEKAMEILTAHDVDFSGLK
jgi:putative redox-active protein with C_GCAxxG_C_C motif